MEDWNEFYKWLESKGYNVYRQSNIFRGSKFITAFDPIEDADSGEINNTIKRIKKNDVFNFRILAGK
jgi:hypothetical protein